MEHQNFPECVKHWMEIIKTCAVSDPPRMIEHCDKLESYANEIQSDHLMGYSLFYRGYHCYAHAQLEDSMNYLSIALNHLISGEIWELAARTYNGMGNIAEFQGDISLAIDCYAKGLALCAEYKTTLVEYDIWSNIGNIYISLNEPANAVQALLKCEQLVENGLQISTISKAIVCANLAVCYIRLNELEHAQTNLDELKKLSGPHPSVMDQLSIYILEAELFHKTGNTKARDAAIEQLHKMQLNSMNVFDALSELCRHAMLLLELDKLPQFLSLVDQIESHANTPAVQKHVLDLRLKYYQQIGDEENYTKSAVMFYSVAQQREQERNQIVSHNIMTRIRLDEEAAKRREAERSNLILKQRSEHDALTGMNNRYKLNELAELAFHRAYDTGYPLTIEILDIDCYKEFNDNYGHQAGDNCLIQIANTLRNLEQHGNIYTARYGGDEFVIIYENYSQSEVDAFARQLMENIHALNIEHKHSKVSDRVSVSQGLFHKIPANNNKLWDFLYGADMALYGIKNRTKGNYHIATDFEEVRIYSGLRA
ncbi:MAG: diguanylate cyclase [Oscillospiraceae bacterium]|nr:diguanylate cyclase [Oscillospiraceae bacterium]